MVKHTLNQYCVFPKYCTMPWTLGIQLCFSYQCKNQKVWIDSECDRSWQTHVLYLCAGANNQAMIRVLSLGSAERTLLKGFTGAVTDLAFAHLDSTLLGCVDEAGNLVIWQLTCHSSKILYPPHSTQ